MCVVAGGEAGETFDRVEEPVFSPDGRAVAYAARAGDEWFVVAGARKAGPFAWAGPARWSADGSKVAFGAFEGAHHEWKVK
jgi:hypothetical protein